MTASSSLTHTPVLDHHHQRPLEQRGRKRSSRLFASFLPPPLLRDRLSASSQVSRVDLEIKQGATPCARLWPRATGEGDRRCSCSLPHHTQGLGDRMCTLLALPLLSRRAPFRPTPRDISTGVLPAPEADSTSTNDRTAVRLVLGARRHARGARARCAAARCAVQRPPRGLAPRRQQPDARGRQGASASR